MFTNKYYNFMIYMLQLLSSMINLFQLTNYRIFTYKVIKQLSIDYVQMLKNMDQILKFIYVLIISISLFSVTSAGRRPFSMSFLHHSQIFFYIKRAHALVDKLLVTILYFYLPRRSIQLSNYH